MLGGYECAGYWHTTTCTAHSSKKVRLDSGGLCTDMNVDAAVVVPIGMVIGAYTRRFNDVGCTGMHVAHGSTAVAKVH